MFIYGNLPVCKCPHPLSPNAKQPFRSFKGLGSLWESRISKIHRSLPEGELLATLSNSTNQDVWRRPSSEVPSFVYYAFHSATNFTSAFLMTHILSGPVCPWGLEEPLEFLLFGTRLLGHQQPGDPRLAPRSLLSPGLAQPARRPEAVTGEEERVLSCWVNIDLWFGIMAIKASPALACHTLDSRSLLYTAPHRSISQTIRFPIVSWKISIKKKKTLCCLLGSSSGFSFPCFSAWWKLPFAFRPQGNLAGPAWLSLYPTQQHFLHSLSETKHPSFGQPSFGSLG